MKYEDELQLEKAKAQRLQRQGLPIGTKQKTTEADVAKAKADKLNRTYKK